MLSVVAATFCNTAPGVATSPGDAGQGDADSRRTSKNIFFFVSVIFLQQKTICFGESSEPGQLHQLKIKISPLQDSKQEKTKARY